ncbi:MAG: hypothetical protein K8F25_00135, partial [Fimbriimonadaceae bacterium]|nr:hypothetical protein [Alphaproteobacteria bacterium]
MATMSKPFAQFLSFFGAVRNAAGDDPRKIAAFYGQHKGLTNAVDSFRTFMHLSDFERRIFHGDKKFFPQVPDTFEKEWKTYKNDWSLEIDFPGGLNIDLEE